MRTAGTVNEWKIYLEFIYLAARIVDTLNASKPKPLLSLQQISINSKRERDGDSNYYMESGKPPQ